MMARSERSYQDLFHRLLTDDDQFKIQIVIREWVDILPE